MKELLAIPLLIGVYLLLRWELRVFRRNVKQGDVVGVRFGDYVVNRKVERASREDVVVKNLTGTGLKFVRRELLYIPDRWSETGEVVSDA